MVHIKVFRINFLHVAYHLVGNAKQRGVNHIVLPQLHLVHAALVEQGKLLQEFLQSQHLAHLKLTVLVFLYRCLCVQRIYERVGYLRVETALHILLQLLRFQHLVATSSLHKYLVNLAQQHGLLVSIRQTIDGKVRLQLSLVVRVCLNGYRPQVNQLQYACRQQVVVVGPTPLVSIQHIVSLLQIAVQRNVAIPYQVLVHAPSGTPLIYQEPDATHHGRHKNHQHVEHAEQCHRVAPVHLLVVAAGIVAALQGHLLLLLKRSLVLVAGFKQSFRELGHHV